MSKPNITKRRAPRLTEHQRLTIRLALRGDYDRAMACLDMHGISAGHFLEYAGDAWDAYKAFSGHPMHSAK